jgi:hypothetical protein
MVIRMLEDRAVVDEQAVLVDERPVAHLPTTHAEHIVGVHALCRLGGVRTAKLPLVEWRQIPHPDALADGPVLGVGITEIGHPEPACFLDEPGGLPRRDRMKRGFPAHVIPPDDGCRRARRPCLPHS